MSRKCNNCNKYLCKIPGYKKIIKNEEEAKVFSDCLNKIVIVNDIFCKKCRLIPYINKKASTSKCAAFNLAEIMDDQNNLSVQYVKSAPNIIKAETKLPHGGGAAFRNITITIPRKPSGEKIEARKRKTRNEKTKIMAKYIGLKGDVADFFSQFNIIAAAKGYQESTKKLVLAAYLAGPALLFYNKIKDNCETFQELQKQISEEFSSTENSIAIFFARGQGATEDPLNYFYSLDYLAYKAEAVIDDKCFIQHFLGAANFQTKGRLGSQLYTNRQHLKEVIKQLNEIYNRGDGEADINLPVKFTNIVDVLPSSSTQGGQGDQRPSTSIRPTRTFSSPSFTPRKIPPPDQMMPRPYNFRPRGNTKPHSMMTKKNNECNTKAAEAIEVIAEDKQPPHSKNILYAPPPPQPPPPRLDRATRATVSGGSERDSYARANVTCVPAHTTCPLS
ncbi:unnamed protein product [Diatraea saccharalis]|uniref:Uncharacterized protein n=1 Tax=Diatraea saccharalis TaxID=40085 RepID=A0A9N9QXQ6_9NEOP|nr:unnamed protein product [Diatraea saccharalis]